MKYLFLAFLITHSFAYTYNNNIGATFSQDSLGVDVSASSTCTNALPGVANPRAELLSMIQEAVAQFWNTVPTSRLRLFSGVETSAYTNLESGEICDALPTSGSCSGGAVDVDQVSGGIVVACNSDTTRNFTSTGILAVAQPVTMSGRQIRGSVVLINDAANTAFASLSRSEKVTVLAHEIGHAFGLGHTNDRVSLMYAVHRTQQNYLSLNDSKAVSHLYPRKEKLMGVACGTVNDISKNGPSLFASFIFGLLILSIFKSVKKLQTHKA